MNDDRAKSLLTAADYQRGSGWVEYGGHGVEAIRACIRRHRGGKGVVFPDYWIEDERHILYQPIRKVVVVQFRKPAR